MKAPFYEIEKDENFDSIADILLNDKQSLHFVRRRNLFGDGITALKTFDYEARHMFDDDYSKRLKTLNTNYSWIKYWIPFQAFFLICIGVIIYWSIVGIKINAESLPSVILVIILSCILGFVSVYLIVIYLRTYFFLKKAFFKMDDLYVIYDKNLLPYSIEVRGNRIRVLYKQSLYIINKGKIKRKKNPLTIYCSYLNMYPQSALDIGRFVPEHRPPITEREKPFHPAMAGNSYISGDKFSLSLTTYGVGSKDWRVYKYVFDFNKNNQLDVVYSAATESIRFRYYYITRAEVIERGESVNDEVNKLTEGNCYLKKLMEEILE